MSLLSLSPLHGSQLPKVFRAASFRLCDVHEGQHKDKIQTNDKMECFGFVTSKTETNDCIQSMNSGVAKAGEGPE